MRQEQSELAGLFMMLLGDVNICREELAQPGAPTHRDRTYARALFALIEGVAYRMRQVLIAGADGTFTINEQELAKLREVRFVAAPNGTGSSERPALLPVVEGVKFTMELWARCFDREISRGFFSDARWQALQRAVKVRHALMHPKNVNDLVITPTKLRDLQYTQAWFIKITAHLLQAHYNP